MNGLFYEVFKDELLKEEKIIWTGQPETSVIFTNADIFLVPFSLFWGGFAIFWEASVLFMGQKSQQGITPIFFALSGIPFVLVGLYLIFGRFIYKNFKKKRTYYAITDKRVIVLTKVSNKNVQAEFIDRIPGINKSIRSDGIGTIQFGNSNRMFSMYGNTGMDFLSSYYWPGAPIFYDVQDAGKVCSIINDLQRNNYQS